MLFRAQPRHLASASAAAPQTHCRLYAISTLPFSHNARSRGRNAFPPHYAQVSETVLPAELYAGYTVVEYAPPAPPQAPPPTPPAFVFLLDLALESTEIEVGFERLPCKTLPCHTCADAARLRASAGPNAGADGHRGVLSSYIMHGEDACGSRAAGNARTELAANLRKTVVPGQHRV